MSVIFLAIFFVFTSLHLYGSAKQNKRLRNLTKPFLLSSLFGFYFFTAGNALPSILIALFFCWLGDILLMKSAMKWLIAGGISFMIGHVFFMIGYSRDITFSSEHLLPALLLAALFVFAAISIFLKMKPDLPQSMVIPMIGYLLINAAMNCFAILRMISMPGIPAFITCIGAMQFFVSDSFWFYVRFKKEGRLKTHFWIMLTYSLGELMIIIGLI